MKIEKIEKSKREQERVLVHLEGETFFGSPRTSFCVSICIRDWTSQRKLW